MRSAQSVCIFDTPQALNFSLGPVDVGYAQVHQCAATFLERHASLPVSAVMVTGPEAVKAFVLRFAGEHGRKSSLRGTSRHGRRMGISGHLSRASGGSTRPFVRSRQVAAACHAPLRAEGRRGRGRHYGGVEGATAVAQCQHGGGAARGALLRQQLLGARVEAPQSSATEAWRQSWDEAALLMAMGIEAAFPSADQGWMRDAGGGAWGAGPSGQIRWQPMHTGTRLVRHRVGHEGALRAEERRCAGVPCDWAIFRHRFRPAPQDVARGGGLAGEGARMRRRRHTMG